MTRTRRAGDQPVIPVLIKFGESELAEIDAAAEAEGDDRSTFVRDAALERARHQQQQEKP